MDSQKTILIVAVVAIIAIAAGAAVFLMNNGSDDPDVPTGNTVVDVAGRTVEIPDNLDNGIVTVGKLSVVRMLSYFPESFNKIKMVDLNIQSSLDNAGQNYAYIDSMKAVIAGAQTHETDTLSDADKEAIGILNPSLIIVNKDAYSGNKDTCDLLAKSFTLIVVDPMSEFDYNPFWTSDYQLKDNFKACFTLFGKILKQEDRAKELINGMNSALKDLKGMMSGTAAGNYYVSGISYMGVNDLLATFPNFLSLMMINGTNSYVDAKGHYDGIRVQLADGDALTEFKFTDVIIDPSSFPKLNPTNENSQIFLKYVYTKNQETGTDIKIHVIYPMVAFGTNWETAIINAMYLANMCYGEKYTSDELAKKSADLMDIFFKDNGKGVLKGIENSIKMKGQKAAGGQDLSIFSDQTVILKDGKYYLGTA